MNKSSEGIVVTNIDLLKKFKRWMLLLILVNIFTMITTVAILGSMQQLYGKIQRMHLSNNSIVQDLSDNFCLLKIKNVK